MNIEIPDLNDVEFVTDYWICRGVGKLQKEICYRCHGEKKALTPVGVRLMEFLTSIGVPIMKPEGWKE